MIKSVVLSVLFLLSTSTDGFVPATLTAVSTVTSPSTSTFSSVSRVQHFVSMDSASLQGRDEIESSTSSLSQPNFSMSSPGALLGKPIDQDTKKRNKELVHALKGYLFDFLFAGETIDRAYARFYALETIARMPYFSYLSVLHLFETLGWWRKADYLKIHFSETWNELHHLLIMEELGGNDKFTDRFIAQHVAFFYYWTAITLYLVNPVLAYNLNQAVEEEAYETYDKFLTRNKDYLEKLPATETAKKYYRDGDLYMFDQMHTTVEVCDQPPRRPKCDTLYDVFVAIRDDELEHVKTMKHLQGGTGIDSDVCSM